MFFPLEEWLPAFVLTVLVEGLVVLALLRRSGVPPPGLALLSGFANLATHPVAWFVVTQLYLVGTAAYVVAAEGWAVIAETVFWRLVLPGVSTRRVIAVAVATNGASFVTGQVLGDVLAGIAPSG